MTEAEKIENALAVSAAANELPMPWLVQDVFPAKKTVQESFVSALGKLPESDFYDAIVVRAALQSIISGPDPRGWSFKAQAIRAAALLHEHALKALTAQLAASSDRGY